MSSGEVSDKQPAEEYTIARPLRRCGPVILNFTHRRMYSISNFDTPFDFVNQEPPVTGDPTQLWVRNQFRILPLRAATWWMSRGELALILGFDNLKFLEADLNIHNHSMRTQFVTGSSSPGFANSNMQMHGYIFNNPLQDMPCYDIWQASSRPVTGSPVTGYNIANQEWPEAIDTPSISVLDRPNYQFVPLNYVPWMLAGWHSATTYETVKPADPAHDTRYQTLYNQVALSHIIGKKVKDWTEKFDLAKCWGNKWIPIKGRNQLREGVFNYSTNAAGATGGLTYTLQAGVGQMDVNTVTTFAGINVIENLMITPAHTSFEADDGYNDQMLPQSGMGLNITAGDYVKSTHKKPRVENLWMGVEHLTNQDGSIVPMIWDFYVDTNITVEVNYKTGGHGYEKLARASAIGLTAASPQARECYYTTEAFQSVNNNNADLFLGLWAGRNSISTGNMPNVLGSFGNLGVNNTVPIAVANANGAT